MRDGELDALAGGRFDLHRAQRPAFRFEFRPELVAPANAKTPGRLEGDDLAARVEAEDPHLRRGLDVDRLRGNRDVGALVVVRLDERRVVHAIEMIAGQDQVMPRLVLRESTAPCVDAALER